MAIRKTKRRASTKPRTSAQKAASRRNLAKARAVSRSKHGKGRQTSKQLAAERKNLLKARAAAKARHGAGHLTAKQLAADRANLAKARLHRHYKYKNRPRVKFHISHTLGYVHVDTIHTKRTRMKPVRFHKRLVMGYGHHRMKAKFKIQHRMGFYPGPHTGPRI